MKEPMYDELVRGLLRLLPEKAVQIVLYGSVARGTALDGFDSGKNKGGHIQ